jgi:hypothetical protein
MGKIQIPENVIESQKQEMEIVIVLGARFRKLPNVPFGHFPLYLDSTKKRDARRMRWKTQRSSGR